MTKMTKSLSDMHNQITHWKGLMKTTGVLKMKIKELPESQYLKFFKNNVNLPV